MPVPDRNALLTALTAKRNNERRILSRSNVIATGVGYKIKGETLTRDLAVMVSVIRKLPVAQLAESDLVPKEVDGVHTDVVETGTFRALEATNDRWRPLIPPGVSIGHLDATAGTLGCLVRRGERIFVLSNNHVLANANQGKPGDPILQPGRHDGGDRGDRIGVLADYVPLDFGTQDASCAWSKGLEQALNFLAGRLGSSHRLMAFQESTGSNLVDAALAVPDNPEAFTSSVIGIGRPAGIRRAGLGDPIKKTGRTTGFTQGKIIQIDVTSQVYIGARQASFQNQYMASSMSAPGDSGAAVFDQQNNIVGLLFAGSDAATLFNPIQTVLQALDVEIVT
jgi:hypothetical protein